MMRPAKNILRSEVEGKQREFKTAGVLGKKVRESITGRGPEKV